MKKIRGILEKVVTDAAVKIAGVEENTMCRYYLYQPREPKELKRLRKYAGGYHARTKMQCYLISVGMLVLAFAVLYQPEHSRWTYLAIAAIFGGCIYRNAPIDNENKVLDAVERKMYRKRARIVLGLESIVFAIAWALGWRNVMVVISMCFGIAGVALMAGKIKNAIM